MRINGILDFGASHPFRSVEAGQVMGSATVEGRGEIPYPRGGKAEYMTVSFWVRDFQGRGGNAANSAASLKLLLRQLEEFVGNRDMNPAYIEWEATADPNGTNNTTEHDGWWIIHAPVSAERRTIQAGIVKVRMNVTKVAGPAPVGVGLWYTGGKLSSPSPFSGAALNLLSLPVGSTSFESSFVRTGAEGAIRCILSPSATIESFVLPTVITNLWKGGVHVYDTINTITNPVPTTGGTFVHANWVEVFSSKHNFVGDCVITNGLQLILTQAGQGNHALYIWNTALATANWQLWASLAYLDSAGSSGGVIRNYSFQRISPEECSLVTEMDSATPNLARFLFRLQRGRYEIRVDYTPRTASDASQYKLELIFSSTQKIQYNHSRVGDITFENPAVDSTYGYSGIFGTVVASPFIGGFLYRDQPGSLQSGTLGATTFITGDSTLLAKDATRSYGVFAIPFGVSGIYSPANLQAEGESGTLSAGWSSVADGAASNANAIKYAAGSVSVNQVAFGSAWTPPAGTYDVWFRMKVGNAAGAANEMNVGLALGDLSNWITGFPATYKPNLLTTSYAWYRAGTVALPTGQSPATVRFLAQAVNVAASTDWFVDEAVLVPKILTADNRGPQDLWQQFIYDREAKLIRLP